MIAAAERSGSGKGRHQLVRVKNLPQLPTTKLKRKIVVDGQETSVELFWESGQIVLAPSIHPDTGKPYTVENAAPIVEVDNLDDFIAWVFSIAPDDERADGPREPQRATVDTLAGANQKYAQTAIESMFDDVARQGSFKHDFQNDACNKAAWKAAHYGARGDASYTWTKTIAEKAMRANTYIANASYLQFEKTFDSGWNTGLNDTAYVPKCYQEGFGKKKPKKSVRRRLEKEAIKASRSLDCEKEIVVDHVNDVLTSAAIAEHTTLLIQAGTGMGKTTAIADYERTLPEDEYITALAQFRLLTSGMHTHMPSFTHYEQADGAHQRLLGQVKRLITSLSSLAKFDRHGGRLILDEVTGVLQFLAESSTFQGGAAVTAYRALVRAVETATQVIGMDANLDDITIDFMKAHRGTVTVRRYARKTPRGLSLIHI